MLGVTVHWFDSRWELQHSVLSMRHIPDGQSAASMSGVLLEILTEFELRPKVCAITVDNAFANTLMVTHLAGALEAENPFFAGD